MSEGQSLAALAGYVLLVFALAWWAQKKGGDDSGAGGCILAIMLLGVPVLIGIFKLIAEFMTHVVETW